MFHRAVFSILLSATIVNLVQCDVYRLPNNVRPIRYFLTVEPHLPGTSYYSSTPLSYNGSITMELEVLENTKNITFYQKELKIDVGSITFASSSGEVVKLHTTSKDKESETYTIQLENELQKGENLNLTIDKFSGHIRIAEGFIRAFYDTGFTGRRKYRPIAVTQFEPTSARRAFPCFDEPALKAKFVINIIRPKGYNSISNEELESTEDLGNGRFKDMFKETPAMSTYLVAFAVTDYKHTEKVERHRIFAKPDAIDNGDAEYSLKIAVEALQALEEYTGIKFPLSKIDQIAIPDQFFLPKAMENWGLVTYGETNLLRNDSSSAEALQKTLLMISHEFAHQWFGNLVTPAWWDYLWLGESFASYFQFLISSQIQPSWRLMDQFVVDEVQKALHKEESDSAYPLNYPVERSGQYAPIHILYLKGGSLLRMTEHFLTHDVFRRGLQIYLENGKFKSAVPSDLYSALQQAVHDAGTTDLLNKMTVAEILKPWHNNKGFPVVTVTRNYETGAVTLKQKSKFDKDTKWVVPINHVFSASELDFSKTTADFWLTEESVTLNDKFPTEGWLLVNKQQTGYYRVNYDLENWKRIIEFLKSDKFTSIHVLNRAQLIDDAFNLASSEVIPWEIPLTLCEYLVQEKDYIPFAAFYVALDTYVTIYEHSYYDADREEKYTYFNYTVSNDIAPKVSEYEVYKEYIRTTLGDVKESLGFEPKPSDTHLDKIHREKFLNFREYFS